MHNTYSGRLLSTCSVPVSYCACVHLIATRVAKSHYTPNFKCSDLAVALQQASTFKMWVGVPEFVDDVSEPAQFGGKVKEIENEMKKAGMDAKHSVFVAHSEGGVMTQLYANGKNDHDAIILMGATILRKYRDKGFGVPVLTLDGDLDGLLRITRQAEGLKARVDGWFYHTHFTCSHTQTV